MTALWFFAGLCILGFIGVIIVYSPIGRKWIHHLDD